MDAGDAFQKGFSVTDADRKMVEDAADLYLKVYKQMGVKAYNIGDRDLALGIDSLKAIQKKAPFPILSANLLKDGKPIFQPSTVLKVAGYDVGVVGVVTALFVNRQQLIKDNPGLELTDPAEAVKIQVAALNKKGVDLIVVLAHLNDNEIDRVAETNPGVHFILGGQTNRQQRVLKSVGNTFLANAYMRGKNLSVFDVHVQNGSLKLVDRGKRAAMEKRITELKAQVGSRERSIELAKKDEKRAGTVDYLERNLVQLRTELQEIELELADVAAPDPKSSYVTWDLFDVHKTIPDEEKVAKIVADFRKVHPDPAKKPRPPVAPAIKGPGGARPGVGPATRGRPLNPRTVPATPPRR